MKRLHCHWTAWKNFRLEKLRKVIAWILFYKEMLMQRNRNWYWNNYNSKKTNLEDISKEIFLEEVENIQSLLRPVKVSSSICKLELVLDQDWFLCVRERLKNSSVNVKNRYTDVVPKKTKISSLIIGWCYQNLSHKRRCTALN